MEKKMSKPREWIVVFDDPAKILGGHMPGANHSDEGIFARVHVIEYSAVMDLEAELRGIRAELGLTKKALRDTANGKPSEWAYVQLKQDADKLAEALYKISTSLDESLLLDELLHEDWGKLRNEVIDAQQLLIEYRGGKDE